MPVAAEQARQYHRDDVGQNARSIIEGLRLEAERFKATASVNAQSAIGAEGARHTKKWTATVASQAQIDVKHLLRDDDLVNLLSVRSEEFNRLIRNLSNDVLDRIERQTLGAIFEGRGQADIAKRLQEIDGIGRGRARLIARDQASKLNGAMNQFRQQQAGITHYKWRTILDGRERPTHNANNGKVFSWAMQPKLTGHPGNEINCRCRALAVITDDPEDLAGLPDEPLSDFFEAHLPAIREVAQTPKQPVFGFRPSQIAERLAMTRELQANVSAVTKAFTEADAERLVIELYGFKPSDDDLRNLLTGLQKLAASRRTILIEAAKARLAMIEGLLTQANIAPRAAIVAPPPSPPPVVVLPPRVTPAPAIAPRSKALPTGPYSERMAGVERPFSVAVDQSREFVSKHGRRTGHEWGIAHDHLGRDIARMSSGKVSYVNVDGRLLPEIYQPGQRITFHHNHPSSSSFSVADLEAFGSMPGLEILYAHGGNGSTYRVVAFDRKLIAGQVRSAERTTKNALQSAISDGMISANDAANISAHVRMLIMQRRRLVDYQFSLSGNIRQAAERNAELIDRIVTDAG